MAENLIGRIICYSDSAQSYDQWDTVLCFFDDSSDTFVVKWIDYSSGDSDPSAITSGGVVLPTEIFDLEYYFLDLLGPTARPGTNYSSYQFCEGETLVRFEFTPEFPYFKKWTRDGDPRCKPAITCDLVIQGAPIVTKASTSTASDGQITITAYSTREVRFTTSSPDRLRFSELDTATDNGDNTYTFTFTNLPVGQYTIYALDAEECQASRTVNVGYNQFGNYGLYRWFDFITEEKPFSRYRLEILKLNFDASAAQEITDYGDSPVSITWNGENKGSFQPFISSEISVRLFNKQNYEYLDLFTQSDSEYLVKVINDPLDASSLTHQAYIIPQLYSEPFIDPPYETQFKATDRLGDLESFDFYEEFVDPLTDETVRTSIRGLNKVKDIVLICLNKLNTGQSIRIGFNLYENSHNADASADPLDQTYVDTDSYYDESGDALNCEEVLTELLTPLGARLFSSGGYWYLCRVEELKGSTLDYRQFDLEGAYESSGTLNPIIDFALVTSTTDRAIFSPNVILGIEECYGKLTINNQRDLFETIIPSFNEFNVLEDGFRGWSTSLNGDIGSITAKEVIVSTPSVSSGQTREARPIRGGFVPPSVSQPGFQQDRNVVVRNTVQREWALSFEIDDPSGGDAFASTSGPIEYFNQDSFQIVVSFQYNHNYRVEPPYVRLKWRLEIDNRYLQPDGTWSSSEVINEYYAENFNQKDEMIVTALFDEDASAVTTGTYDLRIYDISALDADLYATSASIQNAIENYSIAGLVPGNRLIVCETNKNQYYYYELRDGSTTAVGVNIVDPNNGDAGFRWHLVSTVFMDSTLRGQRSNVDYFNVSMNTFPSGQSIEEQTSQSVILSEDNLRELEIELFHFDLDTEVNNAEQMVRNYFKLSDGSPTGQWGTNNRKIQKILENTLAAFNYPQGSDGKRGAFRINGSFFLEGPVFQFYNVFRNSSDNNRIYLVNGCTWDIKKRMINSVEMVEMGSSTDTLLKAYEDAAYDSGYS